MKKVFFIIVIIAFAIYSCKKGDGNSGGTGNIIKYEVQTFYKNDAGLVLSGMSGICAIEDADGLDYLLVIDPVTQIVYKINSTGKAEIFLTLPKANNLSIEPWDITTDNINHFISTFKKGIIKTDYTKQVEYLCGFDPLATQVQGPANTIRFSDPRGLCYSATAIYMTDFGSNLIQQVSRDNGFCNVFAGKVGVAGGTQDGDKANARFNRPLSICVNPKGGFFVGQEATIRKISFGSDVSTLAGGSLGYKDGNGVNAAFDLISSMCADNDGNLYVVDNQNCCIRKIDKDGNVTTLAGIGDNCGYVDGDANSARFNFPRDICLDSKGNFYVTDAGNNKIRIIKPK